MPPEGYQPPTPEERKLQSDTLRRLSQAIIDEVVVAVIVGLLKSKRNRGETV